MTKCVIFPLSKVLGDNPNVSGSLRDQILCRVPLWIKFCSVLGSLMNQILWPVPCNSREYTSLVCLPYLTADFGVKTNTKLTPNCQLREKSKAVCTQLPRLQFLRKFPDVYSLIYIISGKENITTHFPPFFWYSVLVVLLVGTLRLQISRIYEYLSFRLVFMSFLPNFIFWPLQICEL